MDRRAVRRDDRVMEVEGMSRVRFDLRAREGVSRCVLCHEIGGTLLRCDGCGALTHEVCRDEIGRVCPTLGCRPSGDPKTAAQIGAIRVEGLGWIREAAREAAINGDAVLSLERQAAEVQRHRSDVDNEINFQANDRRYREELRLIDGATLDRIWPWVAAILGFCTLFFPALAAWHEAVSR